MKKSVIAILDEDEGFVQRLADYLAENKSINYRISGFTDLKKLESYAFSVDVRFVLVGESILKNEREIEFAPVVRICEEKSDEANDGIYRYKPGEYYVKRFIELTGIESVSVNLDVAEGAKIIGIYSPLSRMLKTTFALTLGQILAKNNRVLYLNFEYYSGFPDLFTEESVKNMGDVIYCFKNINEDFRENITGMLKEINGLFYIKPALSYMDLFEIDVETWKAILTNLRDWGEFDYILLDLSDCVQGLFEILSMCSLIYTVISEDEVSIAKTNQYELMVKDMNKEEILGKTIKYTIPIFRKVPVNPGELPRSEMGSFVKELIRGDFAI